MLNFDYYNPTHIIFGKNRFNELNEVIPQDKKVLILYGGGSVERFGTLDKVKTALKSREVGEFGGIEANPTYETLIKAIQLVKEENYDFLLAVGGGSVIDGTKFVAAGALLTVNRWIFLVAELVKTSDYKSASFWNSTNTSCNWF